MCQFMINNGDRDKCQASNKANYMRRYINEYF